MKVPIRSFVILCLVSITLILGCSQETSQSDDQNGGGDEPTETTKDNVPPAKPDPIPTTPDYDKLYQSFEGSFSVEKAMQLIFGNYDAGNRSSQWPKKSYDPTTLDAWIEVSGFDMEQMEFTSTCFKDLPYQTDGEDFVYLITQVKDENTDKESHADCGVFGAYHFLQRGNRWYMDLELPIMECMGNFGRIDDVGLVRPGTKGVALSIFVSWVGQGEAYLSESWLTRLGDSLHYICGFDMGQDNSGLYGEEFGTSYEGSITYEEEPPKEWYDLIYTKKGTEPGDDWIYGEEPTTPPKQVDSTFRYEWSGSQYKRVE